MKNLLNQLLSSLFFSIPICLSTSCTAEQIHPEEHTGSVIEYRELIARERTEEESAYIVVQIEKEVKNILTDRGYDRNLTYKERKKIVDGTLQTLDNLPIGNAETKEKRQALVAYMLAELGEYRPSLASGNSEREIDRLAEERVARAERFNGLFLPSMCVPTESMSAGWGGEELNRRSYCTSCIEKEKYSLWIPGEEGICAGEGRCGNIGSSKHGYYYTINPNPKRERYEQDIAYPLDTIDQEVKALSSVFTSLCGLASNLDSIKPLSLSMSRGTRIAHTIKSLRVSLMHQLDVLDAFSIVNEQTTEKIRGARKILVDKVRLLLDKSEEMIKGLQQPQREHTSEEMIKCLQERQNEALEGSIEEIAQKIRELKLKILELKIEAQRTVIVEVIKALEKESEEKNASWENSMHEWDEKNELLDASSQRNQKRLENRAKRDTKIVKLTTKKETNLTESDLEELNEELTELLEEKAESDKERLESKDKRDAKINALNTQLEKLLAEKETIKDAQHLAFIDAHIAVTQRNLDCLKEEKAIFDL